jgi:hypothetical protein
MQHIHSENPIRKSMKTAIAPPGGDCANCIRSIVGAAVTGAAVVGDLVGTVGLKLGAHEGLLVTGALDGLLVIGRLGAFVTSKLGALEGVRVPR